MVSSSMITAMNASLFMVVGIPIVLIIIFKKRFGISLKVFFFGMAVFLLFAQILESAVHLYTLQINSTTREWLENPWLYMLYGGLMAGIFEETGRFLAMKYVMKEYRQWKDGLSFGLGHGSMEAILLVGINSITMLVLSNMINNGTFETLLVNPAAKESMEMVRDQLVNGSAGLVWMGGLERMAAIALHIGLSILVLGAVVHKKTGYYLLAIAIHSLFNFPVALYQAGVIENVYVIEGIIFIVAAAAIVWIVKSRNWLQTREEA